MNIKILKKHILFIMMCFVLVIQACKQNTSTSSSFNQTEEINGELVADTIIYSVVIKNTDPSDHWTTECLSHLDRNKLVDQLFESVYKHHAQAYNYLTDTPMSVGEIKAIEEQEDFAREKVGKLQFWESWHYDEKTQSMNKRVHAILVAYEITNDQGELLGYKAAFYIKMP